MTANQLALASLRESTRHNMVAEEENTRHNVKAEELQADANSIQDKMTEYTREYNQEKNAIQREYNKAYLDYLNSGLSEKEAVDKANLDIQSKLADAERRYKENMALLESNSLDIKAQMAENDRMYKEAWKDIQNINADLENKRIEYEATLKREQIASNEKIQHSINALTEWKNTSDYILRMEGVSQGWSDLRNKQSELQLKVDQQDVLIKNLEAEVQEKKSRTFRNYWESVFNAVNQTADNVFKLFDHKLGGSSYGKAKAAAEALFKD